MKSTCEFKLCPPKANGLPNPTSIGNINCFRLSRHSGTPSFRRWKSPSACERNEGSLQQGGSGALTTRPQVVVELEDKRSLIYLVIFFFKLQEKKMGTDETKGILRSHYL